MTEKCYYLIYKFVPLFPKLRRFLGIFARFKKALPAMVKGVVRFARNMVPTYILREAPLTRMYTKWGLGRTKRMFMDYIKVHQIEKSSRSHLKHGSYLNGGKDEV